MSPEEELFEELYVSVREAVLSLEKEDELTDGLVRQCIAEELRRRKSLPLRTRLEASRRVFQALRRYDVLTELMEDEAVTEIMVNGHKKIFYEKEGRLFPYAKAFSSERRLRDLIQRMVSEKNRRANEADPIAETRLSDGSRVEVVLPPVSVDGPSLTIRRFPKVPLRMEDLLSYGSVSEELASFLITMVRAGYNIFISGGTGSGKTSLLSALAAYIPPGERVVTIEDAAELLLPTLPNLVRLECRRATNEGAFEIGIRDLIKTALRMRPSRLIVGEVRSSEAIDMLQAMNTGHDGSLSTGHANSAEEMLSRLETMVLTGMEIPLPAVRRQIASALDLLVHLGRLRDGSRKILSVDEVTGYEKDTILLQRIYTYREEGEEGGRVQGSFHFEGRGLRRRAKLQSSGLGLPDIPPFSL